MRKRSKLFLYAVFGFFLIPLIVEGGISYAQWTYIHQPCWSIEGFDVIDVQFDTEYPWIIYQSQTDPTVFSKRNIYYDNFPFANHIAAPTDDSSTNNKDTFVFENDSDECYGDETYLWMGRTASPAQNALLIIDWTMPSGSGTITSVQLCMACWSDRDDDPDFGNFELRETNSSNWIETGGGCMCYDNCVGAADLIDHYGVNDLPDGTGLHSYELESGVADNGIISDLGHTWESTFGVRLEIRWKQGQSGAKWLKYYTKEWETESERPYLLITYSSSRSVSMTRCFRSSMQDVPFSGESKANQIFNQYHARDCNDFSVPGWDRYEQFLKWGVQ